MNTIRRPKMLLARDLMVSRVKTVKPDDMVHDAVRLLVAHGISGAPVVDDTGQLVGMLSEKDCIQALMRAVVERLPSSKVKDVMSRQVVTIPPETHLLTVAHLFLTKSLRRIPVVRDGKLVGQISRHDLLKRAVAVFDKAPSREAAVLYLSAFEDTLPPR